MGKEEDDKQSWEDESLGFSLSKDAFEWLREDGYTADEETAKLKKGDQLGSYKIIEMLGEGGMGEVYLATGGIHREVAIKILPPAAAQNQQRLARFKREAEILAQLDHPNIARIYEFAYDPERNLYFFVMKYVKGQTIAALSKRQVIPIDECLRIFHDIASALEAAHKQDIVHRDLKPLNVMVSNENAVKLLDFGIGKDFSSITPSTTKAEPISKIDQNLTSTEPDNSSPPARSAIFGTREYMSPEMYTTEYDERDVKAAIALDMWALGMVMFETLAGRYAFRPRADGSVSKAILFDIPDWVALPDTTPGRIRRLLKQLLTKDPATRLANASEARKIIAKCQRRMQWRTIVSRAGRAIKQRPYLLIDGATVVILAVAIWTFFLNKTITLLVLAEENQDCGDSSRKISALIQARLEKHGIRVISEFPGPNLDDFELNKGLAIKAQNNLAVVGSWTNTDYLLKITPLCSSPAFQYKLLKRKGSQEQVIKEGTTERKAISEGEQMDDHQIAAAVLHELGIRPTKALTEDEKDYLLSLTDLNEYFNLEALQKTKARLEQKKDAQGNEKYPGALGLTNYLLHNLLDEKSKDEQLSEVEAEKVEQTAKEVRGIAEKLCRKVGESQQPEDKLFCGEVFVGLGQPEVALQLLNSYAASVGKDIAEENTSYTLALASAMTKLGDTASAEKLYAQALTIDAVKRGDLENPSILYSFAIFYLDEAKYAEAESLLTRAKNVLRKAQPPITNPNVQNALAMALYYQQDQFPNKLAVAQDEAKEIAINRLSYVPVELVQTRTMLYLEERQCDKAIEGILLNRNKKLRYGKDAEIQGITGDACKCSQRHKGQAKDYYEKAIELGTREAENEDPKAPYISSLIAEWKLSKGDTQGAVEEIVNTLALPIDAKERSEMDAATQDKEKIARANRYTAISAIRIQCLIEAGKLSRRLNLRGRQQYDQLKKLTPALYQKFESDSRAAFDLAPKRFPEIVKLAR